MADLVIRKAEAEDVRAIAQMEKVCFSQPWTYESLYQDIVGNSMAFYLVAETQGEIIGYGGVWKILDEGHITNVAVAPEYRRKHVGQAILQVLFDVTEQEGIKRHTLEVRSSNEGAIRLYESQGFRSVGIRPGYYEDDGEDAVIMWRESLLDSEVPMA